MCASCIRFFVVLVSDLSNTSTGKKQIYLGLLLKYRISPKNSVAKIWVHTTKSTIYTTGLRGFIYDINTTSAVRIYDQSE